MNKIDIEAAAQMLRDNGFRVSAVGVGKPGILHIIRKPGKYTGQQYFTRKARKTWNDKDYGPNAEIAEITLDNLKWEKLNNGDNKKE